MSNETFSMVIRGGTVALSDGAKRADVGIVDGVIAAIDTNLPRGEIEIDASDRIVCPGGIDPHAHIEQISAGGLLNADNFESATTSAAFGGTTTVISFAAQHLGLDLERVVSDYHALAARGAVIDYAFHMILADPNEVTLRLHLPKLVKDGHGSVKIFLTYDRLKLSDDQILDVLQAARDNGAYVCAHAENHSMISLAVKGLLSNGRTTPGDFAMSHPRLAEVEAIQRLTAFSLFLDQPIMIFHVSTAEGVEAIRKARGEGAKVSAETCTQYLLLTEDEMQNRGLEGAKWMCSPPLRRKSDQDALWNALACGDLQIVSSDHAPYRFDATGKLSAGPSPNFKQIANGMPGLEARLPLLFDAMVTQGRLGLAKFVELTSEAPAKLYGLFPRKGILAEGSDADVTIWNPKARKTITSSILHDRAGYTPYEGMVVTGWPETVVSRGRVVIRHGMLHAQPGSGRFLPQKTGAAPGQMRHSTAEDAKTVSTNP